MSLRIKGHLDVAALQVSLQVMADRHESLRSVFLEQEGELFVRVIPDVRVAMSRVDLSALRDEAQSLRVREDSEAFLRKPFDLAKEPPFRALIMRLSDSEHIFIAVVHHIAADGGSFSQFARQLSYYYNQQVRQGLIRWSALPGRSSLWGTQEKAFLASPEAQAMIDFWRRELKDFSTAMPWPFAPPALVDPTRVGMGSIRMIPDATLARELMAYGRQDSGRYFRFLLASLFALLHRISCESVITIGVPVHDRRHPDEREMIGLRMKLVPVTVRFEEGACFSDILRQLNIKFREILRNLRVPLGALADSLPLGRTEGRGRIFHTFFNYREDVYSSLDFDSLEVEEYPIPVSSAKSDLSVIVESMPGHEKWIRDGILLKYDLAVFKEEDVVSLTERWFRVMHLFLRSPDTPLGSLDILLPGESETLRRNEMPEVESVEPSACLHDLFSEQARRTPHHPALIGNDTETSYAELELLSESLARTLVRAGVSRDVTVAVRCDRGVGMIVAMLGVMKAGGSYLPIDPNDPPGRVRTLVSESNTRMIVLDRSHAHESFEDVSSIFLDERNRALDRVPIHSGQDAVRKTDASSLAYLMFTSGSTGRPKGVMVEHRNIVNRILFMRRYLGFGPGHRTLFKSSPSFDVSLGEVFLPLVSGGAVVIPGEDGAKDPAVLSECIVRHRVSHIHFVPAMLRTYLDSGYRPGVDDGLQVVWCGGDVLPGELMRRFISVSRARLIHGYGPTETAVGVTVWECRYDHWHGRPPIGRPVDNTSVKVVDRHGRRLPPGMSGEIWVGGAQVARGYLGDEELTRLRFVKDPDDPEGSARCYRTGDRGVWMPDGNLVFLGRADRQLKIGGRRVEPGETEAAISLHPGIRHVHVSGESDACGDMRLAAWIGVDPATFPGITVMYERLSEVLPAHLVPHVIRIVDDWPLDMRGKTDTSALRRMAFELPDSKPHPKDAEEGRYALVRSVWEEVLGSAVQSPQDDFFRSGGHSLLALRLIALLRERAGLQIRLADFYRTPTLSAVASLLLCDDPKEKDSPLPKAPSGRRIPMSHGQRRMWLIDGSAVHPSAYNILRVIPLDKNTTAEKIPDILRRMMERHAILRTRLVSEGGRLLQVVEPSDATRPALETFTVDYDSLPAFLSEERDRAFDLSKAPLWRSCLVQTREGGFLCLVFHHAVTDERSAEIFLSEFVSLASAMNEGGVCDLPQPEWTYCDFAYSQATLAGRDTHDKALSFWKRRLSGYSSGPVLEPDFAVEGQGGGRAAEIVLGLDEASTAGLEEFARKEGVTPAVVLLAGFGVLLNRVSGREDCIVGTVVSERHRTEWQDVMGFFLNTLPLRIPIDGDTSFRSVCRRLKWEMEEALTHSYVPYEEILNPEGEGSRDRSHGLARILFNMHSPRAVGGPTWNANVVEPSTPPFARHELACHVRISGGRTSIRWVYDTDLFRNDRMDAMARRYAHLLCGLVASPEMPVNLQPLLLPAEKGSLEGAGIDVDGYSRRTLHGLVRAMALERPGAIAVIAAGGWMDYGELDRVSDRIAKRLLSLGIERGEPIGVLARRCLELPALLLGVLKAGGAFMPIDPSEPSARIRTMAGIAGLRLLVSSDPSILPSLPGIRTAFIRELIAEVGGDSECIGLPQVAPGDPAYVIHTSGSTGTPKGAVVTHGNIAVRLLTVRDIFGLEPGDRSLLKTPMSFDVAISETFQSLICGGSVVVAEPDDPVAPGRLIDIVCADSVSYLHFTPARLREFLDAPGVERVNAHLKLIRCGGESLPRRMMEECLERLDARLFQSYGPAEAAISVTSWECRRTHEYTHPPIGRPHPGTVLLLLDKNGQPVPPGTTGELYIGGAQVGKGYLNMHAQTRERFVEDPLGKHGGQKFFRSGDLCRYTVDGQLLFVGRLDDQVKVRGVRVEPAEVCLALRECPGVSDAFVLAEPDGEDSNRLVACLAADPSCELKPRDIVRRLRERLPAAMLPSRYHRLDALPLDRNGKVDRRALAGICRETPPMTDSGDKPSGDMERVVSAVWSSLLGVSEIYREDDFFSLGGHSLKALAMLASIKDATGVQASLRDLYSASTLSAFSARLQVLAPVAGIQSAYGHFGQTPIPASPVQRRIWMLQRMFDDPSAFLVSRSIVLSSEAEVESARLSLKALQRRHAILRTRIVMEDAGLFQEVSDPEVSVIPWQEGTATEETLLETLESWRRREDLLGADFLWRAVLVRTAQRTVLYLLFHHAAADAWSMEILQRELRILMTAGGDPVAAGLSNAARGYAEFTLWHTQALGGGLRERHSAFWNERLSDLSGMMRLSPDRVMPQGVPGRIGRLERDLPRRISKRLASLSEKEGLSLFNLLLSAFQAMLHRWTGESDIVLGTPVSLRGRSEWQGVLGCFLNTVPVRMHIHGEETFLSLCARTRSDLEGVFSHSDLPFAEIAAQAGGVDDMPFDAFLQIMFTIVGLKAEDSSEGLSHASRPMGETAVDDLYCLIDVGGDDWTAVFKFDADRYDVSRMQSMLETFCRLLEGFVNDPAAAISTHPLMDEDLRLKVHSMGVGPDSPLPVTHSIHRMFSLQCLRTPDAVALEEAGNIHSYIDLESRSDRLASHLISVHGIDSDDVVAVLMPVGAVQVTSLLAVWKAGASAVPIDPTLPDARIRLMMEESGASSVLVDPSLVIPPMDGYRIIDATGFPSEPQSPPSDLAEDSDRKAYCMFTSGSTGKPKGVFNTHRGFVNMALCVSERAAISEEDRVLQYSSPSFDVSLFEVFTALFNGARVVVAGRLEATELASFIHRHRLTVATLTPLVVGMMDTEVLSLLRVLFTGGEQARPSDMARLCGKVTVFNIYGPTECSVWSTLFPVASPWEPSRKVPIGRPMDNVSVEILDPYGHPVPPGMEGELHISGIGVGLGYMGGSEAFTSGFGKDPSDPSKRIYRTGDMGMWTDDGDILFCGRRDAQVKVMGVRIETEEVRTALERLPEVIRACVMVRRRGGSEGVMIAFAVMADGRKPDVGDMRDRLAELLPSYMLPTRIHYIGQIPKTRHGKTDRAKLEELDEAFLVAQESRLQLSDVEVPQGPYETRLAAIWSSLLNVPKVGREDGFFDLGGDSILLMRLMEAIRNEWEVPMGISRIYSHVRLRRMAEMVRGLVGRGSEPSERDAGMLPVAVWDPPGGRNVFVMVGGAGMPEEFTKYHRIGQCMGDGFRLLVLPDPEAVAGLLPRRRLGDLVSEYVRMIVAEQPSGPYRLMGDCLGGIDAFAVACSLQQSGGDVSSLVVLDTLAPLAPVVRSISGEALRTFESLPETRGRLAHAWFRFRMLFAAATGGWGHPVPATRKEVFEQSIAYGLFDPEVHARECPDFGGSPSDRFLHYVKNGHLERIMPSDAFNPYRYRKNVPAFDIRSDNPVLHALLFGMRSRYLSRKVFSYARRDNRRSDVMAARSYIRRELFHPGTFRGDLDVVMSSRIHTRKPTGGWERHTMGNVRAHRAGGDHRSYLGTMLSKTAAIIKDILDGVSSHGTSRDHSQDRRGLRSGGLQ